MVSECGSEIERLTKELGEVRGKSSQVDTKIEAIESAHAAETSRLEARVGELERDLGKTASSLLKEKKARKSKSSELRRLQRQLEKGESSARCKAPIIDTVEFETRLSKIASALDSLLRIRDRDVALAVVEIKLLQNVDVPGFEAEMARLSSRREELLASEGEFDLVIGSLKSECLLSSPAADCEEEDPAWTDAGGTIGGGLEMVAPSPGEAANEDEGPMMDE